MSRKFRVGITRDFVKPDGTVGLGGIGFDDLAADPRVESKFLGETSTELSAEQIRDYDALLVLAPRVTEQTLQSNERLTIVARFGVGYDNIDVSACTRHGVMLTITPDGVRRPVAVAVMTFVLALSGKLLIKDRLTRAGRWNEKLDHMGQGLTGKTLGVIGLGNIGREVFALAKPFGMKHLACDPFADRIAAESLGVELTDLDILMSESDFVAVCCALTNETRGLIEADRIRLMKATAYLINVARGPIVDQRALTAALQEKRIAGAGLDVFEQEPIDPHDPLLALENVIVTPHGLCWTDEAWSGMARDACGSILDVAAGRIPQHVVNREVLDGFPPAIKAARLVEGIEIEMRKNAVKEKLRGGGVALGTMMFEFDSPGISRIAAEAGAEFVLFDMEHNGWSVETIRTLIATSRCTDLVPMVRVPATLYHFLARVLDVGAMGVMVPMVETPEQAELIVQSAKYPPIGRRGAAFGVAHDDYSSGEITGKIRQANDEVLLIAQIETAQGVESAAAIAAVEGIDVLWIGHFDLTNSLGIPGQFTHPWFVESVERVLHACTENGKSAGMMAADVDNATALIRQGFRCLSYSGDIWIYQQALRAGLQGIRARLP